MSTPEGDTVHWTRSSGSGHRWIHADLTRATIAWRPGGETPRALDADTVAELRALATAVRPEDANEQPSHITYACDEHLAITLDGRQCVIDAPEGRSPPGDRTRSSCDCTQRSDRCSPRRGRMSGKG